LKLTLQGELTSIKKALFELWNQVGIYKFKKAFNAFLKANHERNIHMRSIKNTKEKLRQSVQLSWQQTSSKYFMANRLQLRMWFALMVSLSMPTSYAQQSFSFVALGDLPYGPRETAYEPYRTLIKRINAIAPTFSIHVGDFKSGSTLCSNEEFSNQISHFQSFQGALLYTPGDNEWTDCHRANNGSFDPLERLDTLRKEFFRNEKSFGQNPISVISQAQHMPTFSRYVENLRWQHQDTLFTTLHMVGSNNNFESRDPSAVNEFFHREAANVAWIKDAFAVASEKKIKLLVFAFQADVFEARNIYEDFPSWSGFRKSIGETLLPLAQQWRKPVLIIHGDSHRFRLDQPFTINRKPLTNITRLIVPGDTDVRAVKVNVQGENMYFELIGNPQ
jgi:hypothetical protein